MMQVSKMPYRRNMFHETSFVRNKMKTSTMTELNFQLTEKYEGQAMRIWNKVVWNDALQ